MLEEKKYRDMADSGSTAGEVFLAAQADGLDRIQLIKLVRDIFGLSLIEAKEVLVVAEGWANSLSEYQEQFIPILEELYAEELRDKPQSEDSADS